VSGKLLIGKFTECSGRIDKERKREREREREMIRREVEVPRNLGLLSLNSHEAAIRCDDTLRAIKKKLIKGMMNTVGDSNHRCPGWRREQELRTIRLNS